MASTWMFMRPTASGAIRYRVEFRLGGREGRTRYGGSFPTKREALARKRWIEGELAAMREPDLTALGGEEPATPTLAEAAKRWRESRIDVTEATRVLHRVALDRVLPILGARRVDRITADDVVSVVTALNEKGNKQSTIKKSITYLGNVLEREGIDPNPVKDKRVVLPHEEPDEKHVPLTSHVEGVFGLLDPPYRLPYLFLDWSGVRVGSAFATTVGDYDRINRRIRLRASTTKTRKPLWVDLPPALADTIEKTLSDDLEEPIFEGNADALRTAIARACRDLGIPSFSPHDFRHRRISLLHAQGRTWAEIGRLVGQTKLSVTADTYTHVMSDGTELDYAELLAG